MAKTKTKNKTIQNPKSKTSIFLCCFGSPPSVESLTTTNKGTDPLIQPKQKRRRITNWFSWVRIRIRKNSTSKTMPLEVHYSKTKSKSTLHHHKSQAPATNSPPLTQTLPVHPVTPYYTPTQTRHGPSKSVEDTRQQGRGSTTMQAIRQSRRVSSPPATIQSQMKTSSTSRHKNAMGSSNGAVAGMSVIVVTLVIMIFWGRFCAILCTSAWLYCIPRFRNSGAENINESSGLGNKTKNDVVDLDSEEYKKKVIMEGILERNQRRG